MTYFSLIKDSVSEGDIEGFFLNIGVEFTLKAIDHCFGADDISSSGDGRNICSGIDKYAVLHTASNHASNATIIFDVGDHVYFEHRVLDVISEEFDDAHGISGR